MVLEDESGRIGLVGERLQREQYITGIIMAALGIETPDGEFEVLDVYFSRMAPRDNVVMKAENDIDIDGDPIS
jgi:DNA polymerase delta subunit 2